MKKRYATPRLTQLGRLRDLTAIFSYGRGPRA
jgi:hypothetical protein